jgi:putative membrane protein
MEGLSYLKWGYLLSTVVYSVIGLVFLGLGFFLMDKLSPFSLSKELLEEHNTAIAIVIAGVMIAQGIIIAAVIH